MNNTPSILFDFKPHRFYARVYRRMQRNQRKNSSLVTSADYLMASISIVTQFLSSSSQSVSLCDHGRT
jgi:hypothetical protein